MTSSKNNPSFGPLPPPPVLELTLEQEFTLRHIEEMLNKDSIRVEDLKTLYLAMTKQNFCLTNSIRNLLKKWPTALNTTDVGMSKYGISLETKDWTTTSATQLNTFVEQVIRMKQQSTVTCVKLSTISQTN